MNILGQHNGMKPEGGGGLEPLEVPRHGQEHYLLLSDGLEAFPIEVESTGQTLPFSSGSAVATLFRCEKGVLVGIQAHAQIRSLQVEGTDGTTLGNCNVVQDLSEVPLATAGQLGTWFRLPWAATGRTDLVLLLTTL